MPTNHFGTAGGFPAPVWPPVWQVASDDLLAPVQWYYATNTPGPGLTNPTIAAFGSYISSTPVVPEANLGLAGPSAILHMADGIQPYNVAGGSEGGATPHIGGGRFYVYNPSPVDTVACLIWLGGPLRWLIEPTVGVNGVLLYGDGNGLSNQSLTLTGIPVAQSTPHLIPGAGSWATDHTPGSTAYAITNAATATINDPPFQIGASVAQKRKPYGPSSFDPIAPVPRFALEFALSPLHCMPVVFSSNVSVPVGSAYVDPYSFYVELHVIRTTVV